MAVVNEVMTIINVIMSFALMILIIISTCQDIKARRATNASLDILFKRQQLLAQDLDQLQRALIQVQKSEKDNALAVKATQERIGALQNIEANDVKFLTDDIAIIADMMAQMKFTSYRPNERFQDDMGRILELAKQSRGER